MYIMHFFQEQLADTVLPSADNSKDKLELSEPPQTSAKSDVIDPDVTLISISEEFDADNHHDYQQFNQREAIFPHCRPLSMRAMHG